jgi:hypothetical protein
MVNGVSLHANVAVPARDRKRLERLCRYVARPPVSTGRLAAEPDGRLQYQLKRRWRDGTTHIVFEPSELLERLVALIPPPRAHQVRYHGVLAPAAADRAFVSRDRRSTPRARTDSSRGQPAPGNDCTETPRDASARKSPNASVRPNSSSHTCSAVSDSRAVAPPTVPARSAELSCDPDFELTDAADDPTPPLSD